MFFNIIKGLVEVLRGFFSSFYVFLNFCFFYLIFSYNLIPSDFLKISNYFVGLFLLISIVHYNWRFNKIYKQYYIFHNFINSSDFAMVILDNKNNIINYNDLFLRICEDRVPRTFQEILDIFKDFILLKNTLIEGIATNSFTRDINFGEKIWRISITEENSQFGNLKIIFIIDITSNNKGNPIEKTLANMLNYVTEGIIVTNRSGNVIFYNVSAANILKTSLLGKNINVLQGWSNIQPNIINTIKYNNTELQINLSYHGENFVLHRFHENSNELDDVFIHAPFGILIINESLEIISMNRFWNKYLKSKFTVDQCIAPYYRNAFIEYLKHFIKNRNVKPAYFNLINQEGPLVSIFPQFSKSGLINLFFIEDVNSRDMKSQYLHNQRLYSLGEIVGSVSHDFNNILTTTISSCDAILERNRFLNTNEDYLDLMRIKHSSTKAAELIKQILNLSRKKTPKEDNLNVNDFISEFAATIGRVLGNNFTLQVHKKKNNITIFMNEVSFEQVLVNLVLNARDSMPNGGILNIVIDKVTIDKDMFENGHYVVRGEYLELSIIDTGSGISKENLGKIFDPFFTTKNEKGNGFGLATVNSIIKQKCGFIKVSSKFGFGTTFFIYLPLFSNNKTVEEVKTQENSKANILFVEDEINILVPTVKTLKLRGLDIIGVSSGAEAIEKFKSVGSFDLLIMDICIPPMNGIDIYLELKKINPNLKCIFTSGYSNNNLADTDDKNIFFLEKPYSIKDLFDTINKFL